MFDEIPQRPGVELVARDLSLELPGVGVGIEDSVAEKILEGGVCEVAFGVDVEVGLEDVLDDGGVGGEDLAPAKGSAEDEGVGGRAPEEVCGPLDGAVAVSIDGQEGADEWVGFWEFGGLR